MCGRFTIISDPVVYQMEFDIKLDEDVKNNWKQSYNVSPSQIIPVAHDPQTRTLSVMQWGLVPNWSTKSSFNLINVRSETIREKAYFRRLVEQGRRCLIFADGFYEWQQPEHKGMAKVPFYFHLKDNKPFAFAGVWEASRKPDHTVVNTCAIITCPPNSLVGQVHSRMPVMLNPATSWEWLAQNSLDDLLSLLRPFPADAMQAYAVGNLVNNPRADLPECIQPVDR